MRPLALPSSLLTALLFAGLAYAAETFAEVPPPPGWERIVVDGGSVLRLSRSAADSASMVQLDQRLTADAHRLRGLARIRLAGFAPARPQDQAQVSLRCLDRDGRVLAAVSAPQRQDSGTWMELRTDALRPPAGTASVRVVVGLWGAGGTLDVAGLDIETVQPPPTTDAQPTADLRPRWGEEPIERESELRQAICLNGVWQCQPATSDASPARTGWGLIRVPGSWSDAGGRQFVAAQLLPGAGPAWPDDPTKDVSLTRMWLARDITVPAAWRGYRIVLRCTRLGTRAEVRIDGRPVSAIRFPGGDADITTHLGAGGRHRLELLVTHEPEAGEDDRSDYAREDIAAQAGQGTKALGVRGLLDDVLLMAEPAGPRLDAVAIRTSVTASVLGVQAEVAGAPGGMPWQLSGTVADAQGAVLRRLEPRSATADPEGTIAVGWAWADAPRWSPEHPQQLLLDLQLAAPDGRIADARRIRFGFREFTIDGRQFRLNGNVIRLRPAVLGTPLGCGIPEVLGGWIDWHRSLGFNFLEVWPGDHPSRTDVDYVERFAEEASRRGFLLSAVAPHMRPYIRYAERQRGGQLAAKDLAAYRTEARRTMARLINEPSVVMWGTSGNLFSISTGFLPQNVGMLDRGKAWRLEALESRLVLGRQLLAELRAVDPTRPIFAHNGPLGDVDTPNTYLNLIPLQEREEWLSQWAAHGTHPSMFVEFGEPLGVTFHRGRNGYGRSMATEPLVTEHLASYLGAAAYAGEQPDYRRQIASRLLEKDQQYRPMHHHPSYALADPYQEVLSLFIATTRRSWRTWGHSGGSLPWDMLGLTVRPGTGRASAPPPWTPGRRGLWHPEARAMAAEVVDRKLTPIGETYRRINAARLAWIAGRDGAVGEGFTDKRGNFPAGGRLDKQIALINDGERIAAFTGRWRVVIDGGEVAGGALNGSVEAGGIRFLPISAELPAATTIRGGAVELSLRFAEDEIADRLPIRIMPLAQPIQTGAVALIDPAGETGRMLARLGVPTVRWQADTTLPLVIGRRAASAADGLGEAIMRWIRTGGRCLVMAQDPDWLRNRMELRPSRYMSRRVFPITPSHPAVLGLEAELLRDWAGRSTLLEEHPDWRMPDPRVWSDGYPYIGQRWGGRGAVASVAIETPHHGGWTPLLACEFDLAWSPLLEKRVGSGLLWLCGLDLEDHVAADPAARHLAVQLLDHVRTAQPEAPMLTALLGVGPWRGFLDGVGLRATTAERLPPPPALAVIGAEARLDRAALDAFLAGGGRALLLPGASAGPRFGPEVTAPGSLQPPSWPEARGLSPADLRARSDITWTPLIAGDGWEAAADGLLAMRRHGAGIALACRLDPQGLDADHRTYLRYTRWRHTRAVCQLLANLGARFSHDEWLTAPPADQGLALSGMWQARLVQRHQPPERFEDRIADAGVSPAAAAAVADDGSDGWMTVPVPAAWETYGGPWRDADGEAVFRLAIELPAGLAGRDLELSLGRIHAFDAAFWNGLAIGSTGTDVRDAHRVARRYAIPAAAAKAGRNVLAVRVYNDWADGGFRSDAGEMWLRARGSTWTPLRSAPLYHADYRADFALGDDPFRFYKW